MNRKTFLGTLVGVLGINFQGTDQTKSILVSSGTETISGDNPFEGTPYPAPYSRFHQIKNEAGEITGTAWY